jgi:hypothetical protein
MLKIWPIPEERERGGGEREREREDQVVPCHCVHTSCVASNETMNKMRREECVQQRSIRIQEKIRGDESKQTLKWKYSLASR